MSLNLTGPDGTRFARARVVRDIDADRYELHVLGYSAGYTYALRWNSLDGNQPNPHWLRLESPRGRIPESLSLTITGQELHRRSKTPGEWGRNLLRMAFGDFVTVQLEGADLLLA